MKKPPLSPMLSLIFLSPISVLLQFRLSKLKSAKPEPRTASTSPKKAEMTITPPACLPPGVSWRSQETPENKQRTLRQKTSAKTTTPSPAEIRKSPETTREQSPKTAGYKTPANSPSLPLFRIQVLIRLHSI